MSKYKRIALVGPGGCGKNYAVELLKKEGFIYGPSYTTRSIRENEKDGVDYNFISIPEFLEMIGREEFIEFNNFGEHYYGTTKEQFYENFNLFILSPNVIESLPKEDREETYVIYLNIPKSILRKRLFDRGMSEKEVLVRTARDHEMLRVFSDFDLEVKNPTFNIAELLKNYNK